MLSEHYLNPVDCLPSLVPSRKRHRILLRLPPRGPPMQRFNADHCHLGPLRTLKSPCGG